MRPKSKSEKIKEKKKKKEILEREITKESEADRFLADRGYRLRRACLHAVVPGSCEVKLSQVFDRRRETVHSSPRQSGSWRCRNREIQYQVVGKIRP